MTPRGSIPVSIALAIAVAAGAAGQAAAYPRPGETDEISVIDPAVAAQATPLHGDSFRSAVAAGGRVVAFESDSSVLVPGDTNLAQDIFVRDVRARTTSRVSVTSAGGQAIGIGVPGNLSSFPDVSANGRYVSFRSTAVNLVPGDTNLAPDVFVRDRKTGRTERISVSAGGDQSDGDSQGWPSISADGLHVAFASSAGDLVPGDTNANADIFVRDRARGDTLRVSIDSDGSQSDGASLNPSVNSDGTVTAFQSTATNLIDDDHNQATDVFVHDRKSRKTELVSQASDGTRTGLFETSNIGGPRALSRDGRHVIFYSTSDALVPNDGFTSVVPDDVFVRDLRRNRTERVTVDSYGQEGRSAEVQLASEDSQSYGISRDGRFVLLRSYRAFVSDDTEGSPGGITGYVTQTSDAYVYDRLTGHMELASRAASGEPAEECGFDSVHPSLDLSGRFVTFTTCAGNVDPSSDAVTDVFLRDTGPPLGAARVGSQASGPGGSASSPSICLRSECLHPMEPVSSRDLRDDTGSTYTALGANLDRASLVHRPQHEDIFVVIDLEHMPSVSAGASPILYGVRFELGDTRYELRAAALNGGSFGLFDCSPAVANICPRASTLRGGFGSTGSRIVVSLPIAALRTENGGLLSNVVAFSAHGTFRTGATRIIDRLPLE